MVSISSKPWCVNTLRPSQNGRHLPDAIFKCIFLNENVLISIKMSLKFVLQGPINNIPALVQIMAWRRPGDKPLSGPMMVRLPTHICVTRPQWVDSVSRLTMLWLDPTAQETKLPQPWPLLLYSLPHSSHGVGFWLSWIFIWRRIIIAPIVSAPQTGHVSTLRFVDTFILWATNMWFS